MDRTKEILPPAVEKQGMADQMITTILEVLTYQSKRIDHLESVVKSLVNRIGDDR